jgi:hypothetical protein
MKGSNKQGAKTVSSEQVTVNSVMVRKQSVVTMSNEKLAMSNVLIRERSVLLSRWASRQQHYSLLIDNCSFELGIRKK